MGAAAGKSVFARRGKNIGRRTWTASAGWLSWQDRGAPPPGIWSTPTAIARNLTVCNLYVRGADEQLWQKTQVNGSWLAWVPHNDGMKVKDRPAVASLNGDNENVFVVGVDGNVWQKYWNADGGWSK